jgi:hypothetical protein
LCGISAETAFAPAKGSNFRVKSGRKPPAASEEEFDREDIEVDWIFVRDSFAR